MVTFLEPTNTEYYSVIKKNKIRPFPATRKQLEMIIQSEVSQRQIQYDSTYMWNLKYDTNETIIKQKYSQT